MKQYVFLFFIFLFFFSTFTSAQQNHFLYIQAENSQPFYAKLDKKTMSSSASGYLIIPRLTEGTYDLVIGFPKNSQPEQQYKCTIGKKDEGCLLKDFGEKGWGIFNLQSLNVILAASGKKPDKIAPSEPKQDDFSTMLSTVVDDPEIKKSQPVKVNAGNETEAAHSSEIASSAKDSFKLVSVKEEKNNAANPSNEILKATVIDNDKNREILYIDKHDGIQDSVIIYLEMPVKDTNSNVNNTANEIRPQRPKIAVVPADEGKQKVDTTYGYKNETPEKKFLNIEVPFVKQEESVLSKENKETSPPKSVMINSDCRAEASDDDFFKLRKKMAAKGNEPDMIVIAKKAFKLKCFTTGQIKNLAVLFLGDSGKYNFFDAAYPFTSDSGNYHLLETQLTDGYYISRFKAMIRH